MLQLNTGEATTFYNLVSLRMYNISEWFDKHPNSHGKRARELGFEYQQLKELAAKIKPFTLYAEQNKVARSEADEVRQ